MYACILVYNVKLNYIPLHKIQLSLCIPRSTISIIQAVYSSHLIMIYKCELLVMNCFNCLIIMSSIAVV